MNWSLLVRRCQRVCYRGSNAFQHGTHAVSTRKVLVPFGKWNNSPNHFTHGRSVSTRNTARYFSGSPLLDFGHDKDEERLKEFQQHVERGNRGSRPVTGGFGYGPRKKQPKPTGKDGGPDNAPPPPPTLPPFPIPRQHSRKDDAPLCQADFELHDTTRRMLEAPIGKLYQYDAKLKSQQRFPCDITHDREVAWETADHTVQHVEYLLRGWAAKLPGTLAWKQEQRQLLGAEEDMEWDKDPSVIPSIESQDEAAFVLQQMKGLVERLWTEGEAYMAVRADRLQELARHAHREKYKAQQIGAGSDDEYVQALLKSGDPHADQEAEANNQAAIAARIAGSAAAEKPKKKESTLIPDLKAQREEAERKNQLWDSFMERKPVYHRTIETVETLSGTMPIDLERRVNPMNRMKSHIYLPHLVEKIEKIKAKQKAEKEAKKEDDIDWNNVDIMMDKNMFDEANASLDSMGLVDEKEKEKERKKAENENQQLNDLLQEELKNNDSNTQQEKSFTDNGPLDEDDQWEVPYPKPKTLHEKQYAAFFNQFALPGPTTDMYTLFLDALAVCAPQFPTQGTVYEDLLTPLRVEIFLTKVLVRHALDGGDLVNLNYFTNPNVACFNATMRAAASLPYKQTDRPNDIQKEQRDHALVVTLTAFDSLTHTQHVPWSSATYQYLMRLVAKYLPPATDVRGNVSIALVAHCREAGLLSSAVLKEFLDCHTPSNSKLHDSWIDSQGLFPDKETGELKIESEWDEKSVEQRFQKNDETY